MKKFGKKPDASAEEALKRQSERLAELREENKALRQEIERYRARESDVVKTLDFARKKSDEYLSGVRVKYALECDRIARFRKKLQKYRSKEALIAAYDEAFQELKDWQAELEKAAANDLGSPIRDYLSEKKRLGDDEDDFAAPAPPLPRPDLSHAEQISDEDLRELLEQL